MKSAIRAIEKLNGLLGFLAGVCIACGAVLIVVEIAFRIALGKSMQVTDEYTGYLMALSSFMGLGYVEMKGGHIRMDLIDMLKSRCPKLIRALRIFSYVIAILFAAYITVVCWRLFRRSFVSGERSMQISQTALALPQFFLPLGAAALLLQYLCNLYKFCAEKPGK
jgi:TRAP-type C4-dicarboxylate transport system permease small subunit